ncbi:MAG TPA: hypothetical protein VEI51_04780 [Methanomicrobiales archaeon]|nr:hypothetical protein [Methanomicrobiales archaeon]
MLAVLVLVSVLITATYHAYLKITGRKSIFPDDEQRKDSVETTLDLDLPFLQAFDLCKRSVYFMSGGTIESADENTGIIRGWVSGLSPSDPGSPNFTLNVQTIHPNRTRIGIHFFIPVLTRGRGHSFFYDLLVLHFHLFQTRNEGNIKKMRDFLEKYASRADGSAMGEFEHPPDTGFRGERVFADTRDRDSRPDRPEYTYGGKDPFEKNPTLSAILSLFIPGLGQSYQGRYDLGLLIAVGAGGGLLVAMVPGIAVWVYGIYEAYATARRINDGTEPFRPASAGGMAATIGTALAFFGVAYLFITFFGPLGALGFNPKIIQARFGIHPGY